MAKSFSKLRSTMPDSAQKKSKQKAITLMKEMPLNELRAAKKMSQVDMAEALNKEQANISRLEKNTDMYISSLKKYIEAMGGKLDIVASFPDGQVKINQFKNI